MATIGTLAGLLALNPQRMRHKESRSMRRMGVRLDRGWNLFRYHRPLQFMRRFQTLVTRHVERRFPSSTSLVKIDSCRLRAEAVPLLRQLADRRVELWPARNSAGFLDGIAAGRFTFLNVTRDLREAPTADSAASTLRGAIDWNPQAPRLWRFHLQCQESLLNVALARDPEIAWDHIESWLCCERHRAPLIDPDAWHPFCISRRLPVWLMLAACYPPPERIESNFWRSVARQTVWLQTHQERDIGGNHLIENYRALAIAAVSLTGDIHIDIPSLKREILTELSTQVLPSGEHCERAPTYHCLMWLAAMEMADSFAFYEGETEYVQRLRQTVRSMSEFSKSILHPDGGIPLFGDSVFGETPSPAGWFDTEDTRDASRDVDVDLVVSDYWTDRPADGDFLIVDLGQLACDHLPAHGHADLLTLEASLGGQRVVVDSGVYDYEDSDMRAYCRSTAAHNTLQVDGRDHADVWSRFRMGARGHVRSRRHGTLMVDLSELAHHAAVADGHGGEIRWCAAWHDAYQSLGVATTGRVVLSRTYGSKPDWVIVDWVETKMPVELTNRLHFHPDLQLRMATDEKWRKLPACGPEIASQKRTPPSKSDSCSSYDAKYDAKTVYFSVDRNRDGKQDFQVQRLGDGEVDLLPGWYCPEFGVRRRNSVLTNRQSVRAQAVHSARLGVDGNTIAWCGWRISSVDNKLAVDVEVQDGKLVFSWPDIIGVFDLRSLDLQHSR